MDEPWSFGNLGEIALGKKKLGAKKSSSNRNRNSVCSRGLGLGNKYVWYKRGFRKMRVLISGGKIRKTREETCGKNSMPETLPKNISEESLAFGNVDEMASGKLGAEESSSNPNRNVVGSGGLRLGFKFLWCRRRGYEKRRTLISGGKIRKSRKETSGIIPKLEALSQDTLEKNIRGVEHEDLKQASNVWETSSEAEISKAPLLNKYRIICRKKLSKVRKVLFQ